MGTNDLRIILSLSIAWVFHDQLVMLFVITNSLVVICMYNIMSICLAVNSHVILLLSIGVEHEVLTSCDTMT